jgi:dUTP pyrophosphatase
MIQFIKTEQAKRLEKELPFVNFEPIRGTPGSSGYDLRACIDEPEWLNPSKLVKIPTGIHIYISSAPIDTRENIILVGLVAPRSSCKVGFRLKNTIGVIDSDYQGEIMLHCFNDGNDVITIEPGDKIAQLLIVPTVICKLEEVQEFEEVTTRGTGGFGHTGR